MNNNKNKETILANLKDFHTGKKVNIWCAIKGIENSPNAFSALDELIHEGWVRKIELRYTIKGVEQTAPLYQYNILK